MHFKLKWITWNSLNVIRNLYFDTFCLPEGSGVANCPSLIQPWFLFHVLCLHSNCSALNIKWKITTRGNNQIHSWNSRFDDRNMRWLNLVIKWLCTAFLQTTKISSGRENHWIRMMWSIGIRLHNCLEIGKSFNRKCVTYHWLNCTRNALFCVTCRKLP